MNRFIHPCAVTLAVVLVASCGLFYPQDARAFQPEEPAEAPPSDPAVLAILELNPVTPAEKVRTIGILIDLGAAAAARPILESLIADNLDSEALADLLGTFGTAKFLKLAIADDLQPEGKQFADAVEAAGLRRARDPARLAALIDQLNDSKYSVRRNAILQLRSARSFAAAPLVAALADQDRSAGQRAAVATALVVLGSDALGPLLAALDSQDAALATSATEILGRIGDEEAIGHLLVPALLNDDPVRAGARRALEQLLGYVPQQTEATEMLRRRAKIHFDRSASVATQDDPLAEIWAWNAAGTETVRELVSSELAATLTAARFARDAYRLSPELPEMRWLYVRGLLETVVSRGGSDRPLSIEPGSAAERATNEGLSALVDVLEHSLSRGRWKAAMASAELIGRIGNADVLYGNGHRPSALVMAMRHSDRRVRMAALESILTLAPDTPYPGSSRVVQALGYFAAVRGAPIALVADTQATEAQRVAGLLVEMGYDVEIATDGRTLFQKASTLPECELVLINVALQRPSAREALAELRRDSRTALLPVGLVTSLDHLKRAEKLAAGDPLCQVFVRPHTPQAAQLQVGSLLDALGMQHVGHELRLHQAARALGWLAELSSRQQSVYDLRSLEDAIETALQMPEFTSLAAPVLASFGSHRSQRALVNLASQEGFAVETRQAAASAFCASVARFGVQMTTGEIVRQYDRYNNSADRDVETQQILAFTLDCIESQTASAPATEAESSTPQEQ